MSVRQEKDKKKWTKDGRFWYYDVYYIDIFGNKKEKKSKYYKTSKEAKEAERLFLNSIYDNRICKSNMSWKDLYQSFYEYKKDKSKKGTLVSYVDRFTYFSSIEHKIAITTTLQEIELWKREINQHSISTSYKNDILKLINALMNYGIKFHDLNFNNIYKKIDKFNDPNEIPKEMLFYTFEEFQQFISKEKDLTWKTLFEVFYFLGLRKGELMALQWKDVDFKSKTIKISKQIPSYYNHKDSTLAPLKTKSSYRELPLNDVVFSDLQLLYNKVRQYTNFSMDWFIFGNVRPFSKEKIRNRKNKICKLANLKVIRIHDFRHSCASLLINNGASITLVARYLGHSKTDKTLNIYSHLFKSKLDDIVNVIDNLSSPDKQKLRDVENRITRIAEHLINNGNAHEIDELLTEIEKKYEVFTR